MIGTHEELAHKEGLYKTLWDIQGSLESSFVYHVEEGKMDNFEEQDYSNQKFSFSFGRKYSK